MATESILSHAAAAAKLAAGYLTRHQAEFDAVNGKQENTRTAGEVARLDELRPLLQSAEVTCLLLADVVTHAHRLEG